MIVGEHARAFGRDRAVCNPLHRIPVLARQPAGTGMVRHSRIGNRRQRCGIRKKLGRMPNGGRPMTGILGVALTEGLDAAETAGAEALTEGAPAAVVLNILARRREPANLMTIAPPATLRLSREPVANCRR
ncbi:hypothetical protein [Cribrihabitans neustonicus]|uniref:hypothetical protein n=1 Tax=Cribrihabitans neustonicus TaxID=1429085 RepID=UPI003B5B8141